MKSLLLLCGAGLMLNFLTSYSFAQEYEVDEHTLLLCHFNSDSCNADFAKGAKEAKVVGEENLQLGVTAVYGNGAKLGSGVCITYGKENINVERGTFEMWVIPDWSMQDATHRKFYVVSKLFAKGGRILWRSDNKKIAFTHPQVVGSLASTISSWLKSEPHHIAVTWDKDAGMGLYLDGQQTGFQKVTWEPMESTGITIGVCESTYPLNGIIDELRISDIVRSSFNLGD